MPRGARTSTTTSGLGETAAPELRGHDQVVWLDRLELEHDNSLGIGGEGPDEFGPKQVAALVAGLVVVVVGLALALLPTRSRPS